MAEVFYLSLLMRRCRQLLVFFSPIFAWTCHKRFVGENGACLAKKGMMNGAKLVLKATGYGVSQIWESAGPANRVDTLWGIWGYVE